VGGVLTHDSASRLENVARQRRPSCDWPVAAAEVRSI
jgi:hypothetical protein